MSVERTMKIQAPSVIVHFDTTDYGSKELSEAKFIQFIYYKVDVRLDSAINMQALLATTFNGSNFSK